MHWISARILFVLVLDNEYIPLSKESLSEASEDPVAIQFVSLHQFPLKDKQCLLIALEDCQEDKVIKVFELLRLWGS